MPSRPRPPTTGRRVALVGLAALALASGCSPDPDVITISAGPVPTTAPTVADAAPATTEPQATDPGPATTEQPTSTEPAVTAPPTSPTSNGVAGSTLLVDMSIDDVVDTGGDKPPRDHDEFVAVAITDIERWWGEQYPLIYGDPFEPLSGGVYAGYPSRRSTIPGCGEPVTAYDDLQLYVAFYCQFGDFMAYDDGDDPDKSLLTPLADEFGDAVMGVVLAHEYGHAIQARDGALERAYATILTEQQADCFAGAWTGQAYRGESPLLRLGDADIRASLIAMLTVRDPVGTDQFVEGGHGSAFDRVGAFQEGFTQGAPRCAELLDDPLELMPNEFQPFSLDAQLGGNAPYDCDESPIAIQDCVDAPVFLAEDINDFWTTTLGADFPALTVTAVGDLSTYTCDDKVVLTAEVALCPDDSTVAYDEPAVIDLYDAFGDFTLGYFYGIAWAEMAQRVIDSPLVGEARTLVDDCFTGAWVRDITPGADGSPTRSTTNVTSSPGDLDEAIRMAIIVGDESAGTDVVGSPFEKIASFRSGVLGGLDACAAALGI